MVRQWQTLYYGERYSATVINDKVDYCKVAEGLGCMAIRITKPSEVEPALKKALSSGVPTLISVVIGEDDKVFPMVSPGAPIEKAFDASDLEAQGHNA
jgi:acetolactate synthase-1/2/3 large subunit